LTGIPGPGFPEPVCGAGEAGKNLSIFVFIAIAIASMGLFGMAALSTERRTKEVGLRKTFGARTRDIILLLLCNSPFRC